MDVKLSLCIKMLQVLHLLLLYGIFPGWVGGAASLSSAQTTVESGYQAHIVI